MSSTSEVSYEHVLVVLELSQLSYVVVTELIYRPRGRSGYLISGYLDHAPWPGVGGAPGV